MKEGQIKVIDVTCALIVDNQNQVFAAQRSSTMNLPLKWELPGGKIEPDETPEQCLVREIKEELNIQIRIIKEIPSNTHSYPSITVRLIPFICQPVTTELFLKEHVDFKWLNKDELLDLDWAEADIPIVKRYLTGVS
jgi:8-oxo-dGTP diphosphatase